MNPLLYYHTIRHLKPIQIKDRIVRRLKRPSIRQIDPLVLRERNGSWVSSPTKFNSYLGGNAFRFHNMSGSVETSEDWNAPTMPKLWLYHLHYFDFLHQADSHSDQMKWLDRWIDENPPGWGNGWEPYPISRRAVNWIKFHLSNEPLRPNHVSSLTQQADYLYQSIEYHLLGNHLLANAKALFFLGLFGIGVFPEVWKKTGQCILMEQLEAQILSDGAHCERSPMYHSIVLEDLLDIVNISTVYETALEKSDGELVEVVKKCIPRMLAWLQALSHPDGDVAFFNDTVNAMAHRYESLEIYAKKVLAFLPEKIPKGDSLYFPASGFVRVEKDNLIVLADVGSVGPAYQPGHAHAGTFSFEVSFREKRLVVNSGTSCYKNCEDRQYQRSSAAHNTIMMDGQNSSEIWRSHRVAKRSRVRNVNIENIEDTFIVKASQDGFRRLPGIGLHHRQFQICKDEVVIMDQIEGKGVHRVNLYWHFAPTIMLAFHNGHILLSEENSRIGTLIWSEGCEVSIQPSKFWYEFGIYQHKFTAEIKWSGRLPCKLTTKLVLKVNS